MMLETVRGTNRHGTTKHGGTQRLGVRKVSDLLAAGRRPRFGSRRLSPEQLQLLQAAQAVLIAVAMRSGILPVT